MIENIIFLGRVTEAMTRRHKKTAPLMNIIPKPNSLRVNTTQISKRPGAKANMRVRGIRGSGYPFSQACLDDFIESGKRTTEYKQDI